MRFSAPFSVVSLVAGMALFSRSPLPAAPLAGCDFSTAAVFNQPGGTYDIAAGSPDDLDPADGVAVSAWIFANGGGFVGLDANAQVGMPDDLVTKINGDGAAKPEVNASPAGLASVSFSLVIPAGISVNLSSVTWKWRQATNGAGTRWLAFRTSLDPVLTFSEVGSLRNAVDSANIDLTGAAYQNLSGTVTFHWYAGGTGSGDIDFDTVVVNGDVLTGATNPPAVTNLAVTDLTPVSATARGEVIETGGETPVVTVYWGPEDAGTNAAKWMYSLSLGPRAGVFSTPLKELLPATTYYYRCFASNSAGEDWPDTTVTFSTGVPPDPPSVVNQPATAISYTTADLRGAVTATGGETPDVILYFGKTDGGTVAAAWADSVSIGAQSGAFSNSVFNLTHNTTYYCRAFARNSGGSAWAPVSASFRTAAYALPAVIHVPADQITGTAARIGGTVTATGGDAPQVVLFYGESDGGTTEGAWDHRIILGAQDAEYSTVLTGLKPLTAYFFRAAARNAAGTVWAGPTANFSTQDVSEVIINEFMASNNAGASGNPNGWYPIANQVPGTSDDWIEILNTGASAIDLAGWHLTDDAVDPGKWTFPAPTFVPSGGFLLVYASGTGVPDAAGNLHTNFRLAASGEYLALVRPAGTVASEFGPGGTVFPEQENDVSYGLSPTTSAALHFSSPTPGGPNDSGGIARTGDTSFSPDRGYYSSAIDVTITSRTAGATIYYTTDGTKPVDANGNPGPAALVYSGPIPVARTTTIRAAATSPGYAATNTDTQTYLLFDIDNAAADGTDAAGLNTPFLQQTQPAGWGTLTSGDYSMDTRVTKSTATATGHTTSTAQTMLRGLRDIPTISIVMDRADFSGPGGIYTNPTSETLEHECSAEFIPAAGDARNDWQIDCGLKVQGGSSRNPGSSPKHSLNFRFRAEYGAGRLSQALFPGSPVTEFNALALRAGYNNSWIHSDASQRTRASMIRDQWMRQSMLDMGNPAAGRGIMTHVFVNGLYWGVHNLCERPEASHYAAYNGGDDSLLDARNATAVVDGNGTAWNTIEGVVNAGDWATIQGVIDIDGFIDYQIINRYGGNADLKTNGNWRAAGGGPFPAGQPELMAPWQLYSWDGERTLEGETSTLSPLDPMAVRDILEGNAEYRMRFADRLQKHFSHGGALTPEAARARWEKFATELDRAIIAESARWGDHRGTLYTRDNQWLAEQTRLYNSYFPARSARVLTNYGALFPATAAPEFLVDGAVQYGGIIPVGGTFVISSTSGPIYYTTDGSDPRLPGGGIHPDAIAPGSGVRVVPLAASAFVRARVLAGGVWSPISEAVFIRAPIADASNLVISALMYNPAGSSEDTEWVELLNVSAVTIDLSGVTFAGIGYTFPLGTTLASGERIVVVKNQAAFAAAYPIAGVRIAPGEFAATSLDNTGEQLALIDVTGTDVLRFRYNDKLPWPTSADGAGYALVLIAPESSPDPALPGSWRSSARPGGSPGQSDAVAFSGDPDADEDHDGMSAFLEHGLGSVSGDSGSSPESHPVAGLADFADGLGGTAAFLTITFRRNLAADDVRYEVQVSGDLSGWAALGTEPVSRIPNGDGTETLTLRSVEAQAGRSRAFVRLRASHR